MITILSPAKSLDYESKLATRKHTEPRLLAESAELIGVLRHKSVSELAGLMHISDELAALNAQRYADFSLPFTPQNARPAILAFHGDVYLGLDAPATFDERDYTAAQKSLRMLSGLYGVLRPLDLMQPYRLEMGTRLRTDRGATLYDFWGDTITALLAEDLAASPGSDGWRVAIPRSTRLPDGSRTAISREGGTNGWLFWAFCSSAMRHAQPTVSVSTAMPPTTASQMRR